MECNIRSKKPRGSCASSNRVKGQRHIENLGITETSLCRRALRRQKQKSFLDRDPSGLHPQPGGRTETQTPGHLPCQMRISHQEGLWAQESGGGAELQTSVQLPCKRRACLQRVFWPLGHKREWDSQECWQRLKNHRRNKLQPETPRISNTGDYQMARGKS